MNEGAHGGERSPCEHLDRMSGPQACSRTSLLSAEAPPGPAGLRASALELSFQGLSHLGSGYFYSFIVYALRVKKSEN